jgi:hypothetical protein|tara:strand:+ start:293 stop:811 length:519 start_codon:yes stop_codon:yes gene_type:complete
MNKIKEPVGKKYEDYVFNHFSEGRETERYVIDMISDEITNRTNHHINSLGLDECRNLLMNMINGNTSASSVRVCMNYREYEEYEDEIRKNIPNEIIEQEEYNAKVLDWYKNEDFGVERKLTHRNKGHFNSEPKDYTDERIYDKFVRLLKKHGEGGNIIDDISYLYEHRKELK